MNLTKGATILIITLIMESDYETGRRKKEAYLLDSVLNLGYDTSEFAHFMELKKCT